MVANSQLPVPLARSSLRVKQAMGKPRIQLIYHQKRISGFRGFLFIIALTWVPMWRYLVRSAYKGSLQSSIDLGPPLKMINFSCTVALLLSSVSFTTSAPLADSVSGTSTSTVLPPIATVSPISLNPNEALWNASVVDTPQAIRGSLGATVIGPTDLAIVKQNPDLLASPTTDAGTV